MQFGTPLVGDNCGPITCADKTVFDDACVSPRFWNATMPLEPAVPMLKSNGPPINCPPFCATIDIQLVGAKFSVDTFPPTSAALSTGCSPNTEPETAMPGCVVQAPAVAGPAWI